MPPRLRRCRHAFQRRIAGEGPGAAPSAGLTRHGPGISEGSREIMEGEPDRAAGRIVGG
jgi:hypothetical protein